MMIGGRTKFLLAAAAFAVLMGGSAIMAAQGESRSETVAGWRIVEVADGSDDDPTARIIRMTRDLGDQALEYEIRVSAYGGSGWASTGYSAALSHGNGACSKSGSAAVETGSPLQRPARLRALLARELGELEQDCGAPSGTAAPLLEGLDAAFARLSDWHAARLAEVEAAGADHAGDYDEMNMATDMNMAVEMDATDMSMEDGYSEMNAGPVDMNATAADPYASEALESVEDALRSADDALEAAADAVQAEPQRR